MKLEELGGVSKFIVIKKEDGLNYLDSEESKNLEDILESIEIERAKTGKEPNNEYLVINLDEPYAPEIIEIMKRNGHWG
jgi:hypothetical protein